MQKFILLTFFTFLISGCTPSKEECKKVDNCIINSGEIDTRSLEPVFIIQCKVGESYFKNFKTSRQIYSALIIGQEYVLWVTDNEMDMPYIQYYKNKKELEAERVEKIIKEEVGPVSKNGDEF